MDLTAVSSSNYTAQNSCVDCPNIMPSCPVCASDEQCQITIRTCFTCPKTFCAKISSIRAGSNTVINSDGSTVTIANINVSNTNSPASNGNSISSTNAAGNNNNNNNNGVLSDKQIGVVVGSVVGAFVSLILIFFTLWWIFYRKRANYIRQLRFSQVATDKSSVYDDDYYYNEKYDSYFDDYDKKVSSDSKSDLRISTASLNSKDLDDSDDENDQTTDDDEDNINNNNNNNININNNHNQNIKSILNKNYDNNKNINDKNILSKIITRKIINNKKKPITNDSMHRTTRSVRFENIRKPLSTRQTILSVASSALSRASNIIPIAYIPGIFHITANGTPEPGLAENESGSITYSTNSNTNSSTSRSVTPPLPRIPSNYIFTADDIMRESFFSSLSSSTTDVSHDLTNSRANSFNDSLYRGSAVLAPDMETAIRAKANLVILNPRENIREKSSLSHSINRNSLINDKKSLVIDPQSIQPIDVRATNASFASTASSASMLSFTTALTTAPTTRSSIAMTPSISTTSKTINKTPSIPTPNSTSSSSSSSSSTLNSTTFSTPTLSSASLSTPTSTLTSITTPIPTPKTAPTTIINKPVTTTNPNTSKDIETRPPLNPRRKSARLAQGLQHQSIWEIDSEDTENDGEAFPVIIDTR